MGGGLTNFGGGGWGVVVGFVLVGPDEGEGLVCVFADDC